MKTKAMHKTLMYLTQEQIRALRILAKERQITVSDLVRRIIDDYVIEQQRKLRPMRLVVDTNQISQLPEPIDWAKLQRGAIGITLPALIFAELLLRTDPRPSLARLRKFDIQLGDDMPVIADKLAQCTESDIVRFEPFFILDDTIDYAQLALAFHDPPQELVDTARKIKERNRQFIASMVNQAASVKKWIRDHGGIEERVKDMDDAITKFGRGADSFLGSLVVNTISNSDQRKTAISDRDKLYDAVMRNPYLARLYKTILYYMLSYSRLWEEQSRNFDPNPKYDDWTDMTLPLYAAEGDIILTADTNLRNAVALIEPSGKVTTKTVAELL